MAAARPPPTRPHTAIHPPTFRSGDWGEDDVWDSGSDSESPGPQQPNSSGTWNRSPPSVSRHSSANTAPKPVPNKPSSNSSSSTLAFSYTHISAPSPSSYPPQTTNTQSTKNGWTLIGKPGVAGGDSAEEKDESSGADVSPDQVDLEGELVVGDFDLESFPAPSNRMRHAQGLLREDAETIVDDPLHIIRRQPTRDDKSASPSPSRSASPTSQQNAEKLMRERSIKSNRRRKFVDCISCEDISIAELRKLAWSGAPAELRPIVWPLLLGYLPLPASLRSSTLTRRRSEYQSLVELTFARDRAGLDQQVWHQIEIDVPRTRPGVRLWMQETTQRSLERILYVWAIRHPASGYVQGINDLVTPFFQVFLSAYIDSDPEEFDTALLPHKVLQAIEADSFWCLSRLLDGIQDNYISQQPGIHRSVRRMAELVARIDAPLYAHLESENVEFMQFAFRWMNCLLMREISVQNTIRMWDTYLAEGTDAFSQFHLYVCSAFLVKWSKKLLQMDFQGIIMFLQSLPTQDWGDHDVEMLLSEAFLLNSIWHNAQSHFTGKGPS